MPRKYGVKLGRTGQQTNRGLRSELLAVNDVVAANVTPGGGGGSGLLTWAPPTLTNPTVYNVTNASPFWLPTFGTTEDVRIVLPGRPGNPQATKLTHGFGVVGGRNVEIIGGHIDVSPTYGSGWEDRTGLKLRQQRGTIHVEGLLIENNRGDVINMQQNYSPTVQLQNIRGISDGTEASTAHQDVVQTWAGPLRLRIDRMTAVSYFQGFFFHPDDTAFQNPAHPTPELFDVRNVNITIPSLSTAYVFMRLQYAGKLWPINTLEVYGNHYQGPSRLVNEQYATWPGLTHGTPPGGDFVPAGVVGMGYVSPGYQ